MQLKQFSAVNLEDSIESFDAWADKFQRLSMYYLTFHGAQEVRLCLIMTLEVTADYTLTDWTASFTLCQIDKVLDAMGHAVYIYDIAHVIIDNIQFMMGTGPGRGMDRFYLQDLVSLLRSLR